MLFLCSPRMPWHATHKDASKTSLEGQKRSNIQWHSNNSWHLIAPTTSNNIIQWHYPRSSFGLASAVCVMLPCIAWHVKVSNACLRFCSPFFLCEYVLFFYQNSLNQRSAFLKSQQKIDHHCSPLHSTCFELSRIAHIHIYVYTLYIVQLCRYK